ncbi:hypothetical protein CXB51_023940 [Gossypium anomalum]|uniref:UspA domain-containing protein n=1 Tax=Gossypium anomalum TaxID=47600 RepID=A0A8J5YLM6_9ROSI|nr:hypothetical protein CXB51_023940 [Gossypium anomalum]
MVTPPARKVMVVADPAPHSAAALQYALSHALLEQDELILLHVENTSSWKNTLTTFLKRPTIASAANAMTPNISSGPDWGSTDVNFLDQMKYASEIAQPKIPVRIEKIDPDGKDKATGSKLIDTVDYLIENSPCTCVGVQKKGQNGGYVLNSKTQKNFWLLG